MKKRTIICGLLSFALLLGACSKDIEPSREQTRSVVANVEKGNLTIVGKLDNLGAEDIPEESRSEARALLQEVGASGARKALITHKQGTKKIYLLFKRAGASALIEATAKFIGATEFNDPTQSVASEPATAYRVTVTVPTGFESADTKVTGFVATSDATFDATTKTVNNVGFFLGANKDQIPFSGDKPEYDVPMYFVDAPLRVAGTDKYSITEPNLKLYGSLMAVSVNTSISVPYAVRWVQLETEVMSFSGSVDMTQLTSGDTGFTASNSQVRATVLPDGTLPATGAVDATALTTPRYVSGRRLNMDTFKTGSNASKTTFYMWGMGAKDAAGAGKTGRVYATVGQAPFLVDNVAHVLPQSNGQKLHTSTKAIQAGKVYPMNIGVFENEGGLIIAGYYHSGLGEGDRNTIAIYNPTNKPVDLSQYSLVAITDRSGGMPGDAMQYTEALAFRLDGSQIDHPTSGAKVERKFWNTNAMPTQSILPANGIIIITNGAGWANADRKFTKAAIQYNITRASTSAKFPLESGRRAGYYITKGHGMLNASKMNTIVDSYGVFTDKPANDFVDLKSKESYFETLEQIVYRRPDRFMPRPTTLQSIFKDAAGSRITAQKILHFNRAGDVAQWDTHAQLKYIDYVWIDAPEDKYVIIGANQPHFPSNVTVYAQ